MNNIFTKALGAVIALAKARVFVVVSILVLVTVFSSFSSYKSPEVAHAATSSNLNFQARILTSAGNVVPDGYYNIRFKLYDGGTQGGPGGVGQANAGSLLWTEEHKDTNGVTAGQDYRLRVVNGYMTVNLGSQTAFGAINWDQELWLTMDVGGVTQTASPTYDGEMLSSTPAANSRLKLTAVPYAFRAAQAQKLEMNQGTYTGTLDFATLTANRTYLLPDTALATTGSPGTICVFNGTSSNCPAATGSAYYIQNTGGSGTPQAASNFNIQATDSSTNGTIGGIIRGAAGGQTVDLFQLQDGAGVILTSFDASGKLVFGPAGSQDTNLYRSGANTLNTDDNFIIGLDLAVNGGDLTTSQTSFNLLNTTATTVNAFGAATAVNLGADGVVVQGAGSVTLQSGGTNEAIVVQGSGTGSVDIGTNATVHTTTIGSTNGASSLVLQGGTGGLSITTQGTGTLAIGNNAVAQTLAIGNTTGATALNLRTGTGNFTLDGVAGTTYTVGASTTTGTFTLGGTSQTGTTTLGQSTATNIINIGASAGASNTQTINIGTSATASSTTNVTIGSLIGSSKIVLQAGTGGVQIGTNGTPTGQLYIGGSIPTAASGSVAVGTISLSVYVQDNYAYVTSQGTDAFTVYDVSNPTSPTSVGSLAINDGPQMVHVQGRYAYVVNDGTSDTLQVIDVSNPASPSSVASVSTGTSPLNIYVQGRYAYVTHAHSLQIFDVSNPASPVVIGSVATGSTPRGIKVQGRYAYVLSYSGNTLQIFDVSNPASPSSVGSVATGANSRGLYVQGRYAYVVSEGSDNLEIFNITNPASPSSVGSVATGSNPYAVYLQGRYAYVANNSGNSLQVINVSNPASPSSVGSVTTGSGPFNLQVQGRYAYVVNGTNLQTFDMGGAYIQQFEAGGIDTGTLSVQGSTNIGGNLSLQGGLTVADSSNFSGNLSVAGSVSLGSSNTGTLSPWASTTGPGVDKSESGYATYNGYVYAVGGPGPSTSVHYTKINADGSLGTWSTTSSLSTARDQLATVVSGGYIYAIGGSGGPLSSVEYAKINSDGTLGAWTATTSMATGRYRFSAVANNGYIYAIAGPGTATVEYTRVNADGTLGAWTTTSSLTGGARYGQASMVANGYMYVLGGNTGSEVNTTQYAPINANGTLGTWTATTSMISIRSILKGTIANGYVYAVGGYNSGTLNTVEYAPLNANGTIGTWTATSNLGTARYGNGVLMANGYIYAISGNGTTTAEYTSTQRVKIGGSLDLIGYGGETLADGGSAGSLTAGNTNIVGYLQVAGSASIVQNVAIGGTLNVTSDTYIGANLDVAGSAAFKKGTDFSATGTTHNANFGDVSLVRLTGASAQTITGIAGGRDGEILTIINAAGQAATLSNATGSSAGNQIITGTGTNISIPAGGTMTLIYDAVAGYWRVTGSVASSTGGYIQNGTTLQTTANFNIQSAAAGSIGGVIRGASAQTERLLLFRDGTSNADLSAITADGSFVANTYGTATTATTSGTGTNTTTVTLSGSAFANGDVILIDNAGQDYYTRITAGGGTASLTVSPAVTFETGRTVTKQVTENIGATTTDYSSNSNRFFQGYFLGGVVTGAGSTTLSDGNLATTVPTFNLLNSGATTVNAFGAATAINVGAANAVIQGPGNLTLQSAGTTTLNLNNAGAGTVNLGTTNTTTVGIGNTSAAVTIQGNGTSGAVSIQASASGTIAIGSSTDAILNLGTGATTNAITVGGTSTAGILTLGQSTVTNTINIGSANGTTATQTVNIAGGTSTTSGGKVVNIANGVPGAGTTNTVAIGTGGSTTGTVGITIGSNTAADHRVTIQGGNSATLAVTIQAAASGAINIGANNVTGKILNIGSAGTTAGGTVIHMADTTDATNAQVVTIGSTAANTGNITTIQGGSNTTTAIQLIPNTAGGIMIGATAGTGTITLGRSTATNTISIGSGNGTTATQTIDIAGGTSTTSGGKIVNIANGVPGAGTTNTVAIGTGGSTTGTVGITIGSNTAAAHTVVIQGGNTSSAVTIQSAASGSINIGTNNVATKTINMGSVATTVAGTTVSIATTTDATNAQVVTIGSTAANTGNITTIQGGSNTTQAIQITPNVAGGILIGASNGTGQITLGSSSATQTVVIGNGAGASTVSIGNTTTVGSTVNIAGANTATGITDTINIGTGNTQGTGNKVINIGSGTPASTGANTITVGSTGSSSSTTVQAGTGGVTIKTGGTTGSANAFRVQNAAGTATYFNVNNSNSGATNIITIGGNNSGELNTWASTTSLGANVRAYHPTVTANGYVYVIGGWDTVAAQSTSYYAKLNTDGTVGTWTSTTGLPIAIGDQAAVVANGYIYMLGGYNGSYLNTVYYARLNADGTIGAWNTTTNLPGVRHLPSSVVANGYIYLLGGKDAGGTFQNTVYYARLNADGTVGSWLTANAFTGARDGHTSVTANGYVYVIGGENPALTPLTSVQYAKVNSDGTLGAWNPTTALGTALFGEATVVANGYLYAIGGGNGGAASTAVYYARLNSNGTIGAWTTGATTLPAGRGFFSGVVANGYVYTFGGLDSGGVARGDVYYTSTQRIQLGGALDLVGLGGANLADGETGTGGELTAGNTNIVGTLQVAGAGTFAQGLSIGGNLSIGGAISGSSALTVQSGGGNTALTLRGGNTTTTNTNGGNVVLGGGSGLGTGVKGSTIFETPTFSTATVQNFTGSAAVTQANVDGFGAVLISANAAGYTATLNDPTITTAGKILYVTNSGSFDMTLSVNGGGTGNLVTLKPRTTATMIWNGVDWTAAGASSSTDLQAAYDNTATSAGGAEIVLRSTLDSPAGTGGFTIRNNATVPILGGLLEVQSAIGTNLFSVNNLGTELAANGGAETAATFGTNWTAAPAGGTITQTSTAGQFVTGQAGVQVVTAGTNYGVRNNLSANPVVSTTYQVSFTAKLSSGTFSTLQVQYSRDGGTDLEPCTSYSSQTLSTSVWTKITCTITTDGTTATNPDLIIRQTDATGRTFWIDNLSFVRNDATTQPSNVQMGGGINGGQVTLLTLDRSSAPPVANGDTTYLGSMYYDTNTGRIQCYEADGWGACGSAPDNIITLTPEYTGAVLNGTGVGTMTSDFCGSGGGININDGTAGSPTLCASGEARNFYKWTSPQATTQTYSAYVTYKLPNTFKSFADANTIKLTARTDSTTNGSVDYQVFRSTGSAITSCGSSQAVTSSNNTWQQVSFGGDETACGFVGGNYIIFKINVNARINANVYIENLDFTYINS